MRDQLEIRIAPPPSQTQHRDDRQLVYNWDRSWELDSRELDTKGHTTNVRTWRKDIRMTDRNYTSQQIGCHKWMWALEAHIVSYWLYVPFCSESNIIMAVCAIVQWILYHTGRVRHLQWNQLHTVCMSHQWILITSRSLSSTSVNMSTADQISIQDLPSGLFLSVLFF